MITKNLMQHLSGCFYMDTGGPIGYFAYITDITGTEYKQQSWNAANNAFRILPSTVLSGNTPWFTTLDVPSQSDTAIGLGIFVGTGIKPATNDDYALESPISYSDSGLTLISHTIQAKPDKDTVATYTITVKNNAAEELNISEIGLFTQVGHEDVTKCLKFLCARDTFEPVTLQPGETRAFTMTIGLE